MARNKKSILAEEEWLRGSTLKEISVKHSVNFEIIKDWHHKYDWARKRREITKLREKTLFEKILKDGEGQAKRCIKLATTLTQILEKRIEQIKEKFFRMVAEAKDPREIDRLERKVDDDLASCIGNLRRIASVHRNVIPDFNDQLGREMVEELRRRKEVIEEKK